MLRWVFPASLCLLSWNPFSRLKLARLPPCSLLPAQPCFLSRTIPILDSCVPAFLRYSSPNASLDAGALLHKVRVCIQALTKRKLILLPVRQRQWPPQQFRDAIPPSSTCRSKSFFVASAIPTFIQFAMSGASSWRRTIQLFPAMRSSAV
jgi:hypothetical protein